MPKTRLLLGASLIALAIGSFSSAKAGFDRSATINAGLGSGAYNNPYLQAPGQSQPPQAVTAQPQGGFLLFGQQPPASWGGFGLNMPGMSGGISTPFGGFGFNPFAPPLPWGNFGFGQHASAPGTWGGFNLGPIGASSPWGGFNLGPIGAHSPWGGFNLGPLSTSSPWGGFNLGPIGASSPLGGFNLGPIGAHSPWGGFNLGPVSAHSPWGGFNLGPISASSPWGGFNLGPIGAHSPWGGFNLGPVSASSPWGGFGLPSHAGVPPFIGGFNLGPLSASSPWGGFNIGIPGLSAHASSPFGGFGLPGGGVPWWGNFNLGQAPQQNMMQMPYPPYGYAPYGYPQQTGVAPGQPAPAYGASMTAQTQGVSCSINEVPLLTRSATDCEKAGGTVVAANTQQ